MTLASHGSRPAGGKAPGQHGGFVISVKQERGEGPRAGEKGSQEEEVRVPVLWWERPWVSHHSLEAPPWTGFEFAVALPTVQISLWKLRPHLC